MSRLPQLDLLKRLVHAGVSHTVDAEIAQRVRVVNAMSLFSLCLVPGLLGAMFWFGLPLWVMGVMALAGLTIACPLVLNARGLNVAARLQFLIQSYISIASLVLILGREFHYQYYLVAGIGMALLFFGPTEIGRWRWLLSAWALPQWLILEWFTRNHTPWLTFSPDVSGAMQVINDLSMMSTVLFMFYVFTRTTRLQLEALEQQRDQLAALNDDIEKFSYMVSHDLKAPLRGISTIVGIIEEDYPELEPELRKEFEIIKDRAEHMEKLITGVWDYSKARDGRGIVSSFSLAELLEKVECAIEWPEGGELIMPKRDLTIRGQRLQLEQVITILLSNAVKYATPDSGRVELRLSESDTHYWFSVIDDGPGIPEAAQARIFDIFQTAHGRAGVDSTGIGLATAKALVGRNGGEIEVESEVGKGASFNFSWRKAA